MADPSDPMGGFFPSQREVLALSARNFSGAMELSYAAFLLWVEFAQPNENTGPKRQRPIPAGVEPDTVFAQVSATLEVDGPAQVSMQGGPRQYDPNTSGFTEPVDAVVRFYTRGAGSMIDLDLTEAERYRIDVVAFLQQPVGGPPPEIRRPIEVTVKADETNGPSFVHAKLDF